MNITDLKFKAVDLNTKEVVYFTLADLILSKDPPKLTEEMDYSIDSSTP